MTPTIRSSCHAVNADCRCIRRIDHDIHICDCGGSWVVQGDDYEVLAWPIVKGTIEPFETDNMPAFDKGVRP